MSARSATYRRRSKFMLAPQLIAIERALAAILARHVFLDAGHRQGARGLGDGARVLENVLDGGADLIGAHQNDLIDVLARKTKGLLAHAPHGDAVGEHADAIEGRRACRRAATRTSPAASSGSTPMILMRGYSDFA